MLRDSGPGTASTTSTTANALAPLPVKLATLKSKLQRAPTRLATLTAAPQAVERKRGYAGVKDRERIRKRDCGLCQNCGHLGRDVDHDVPLWAGGSDADENKRVLCSVCHEAKSAAEARQRAMGMCDQSAVTGVMEQLQRQRRLT